MSKKRDLMPYSYLEKCLFWRLPPPRVGSCREAECCSVASLPGGWIWVLVPRGEDGIDR